MEHRIMTDKNVSEQKNSENQQPEKKEPAPSSSGANINTTAIAGKKSVSSASVKSEKTEKHNPKDSNILKNNKKSNKTAMFAITLATVSILSSLGLYTWQKQQNSAQQLILSQENQRAILQSQEQLKNSLTAEFNRQLQQQLRTTSQSQQKAQQMHLDSDAQIESLQAQVNQLEQQVSLRKPSDWLVHEAEYLVRIAARTMWLEQDTKAAIGLLRDADNTLKELNQPKFLPVRALINEDIETLALMPTINNQEAVLTLMALNKQIPTLVLSGVNLTAALDTTKDNLVLSDDINDWQENLAKTWQKFLNDFITVRRRTGMVEPLMTPDQQLHLKQNLSLKIQLVQWAASEQKEDIYQQTLLDIQQWLNEFFDMELAENQKFYQAIEQLKKKTIQYDYPSDLRSSTAIKRLLDNTQQVVKPQASKVDKLETKKPATSNEEQAPTPVDKTPEENKQKSEGQL
jgi:uroporphyrin-3 C-methyltransferase